MIPVAIGLAVVVIVAVVGVVFAAGGGGGEEEVSDPTAVPSIDLGTTATPTEASAATPIAPDVLPGAACNSPAEAQARADQVLALVARRETRTLCLKT